MNPRSNPTSKTRGPRPGAILLHQAVRRPSLIAACLGLILLACSTLPVGPSAGRTPQGSSVAVYRGTMRSSCAPYDAPSVELQLNSLSGPEAVSFNLWPNDPVSPPTFVRFDASHPIGSGMFCSASGDCEVAEWGEVEFARSGQTASVTGKWAIGFADGRSLRGLFDAEWLATQAFCG